MSQPPSQAVDVTLEAIARAEHEGFRADVAWCTEAAGHAARAAGHEALARRAFAVAVSVRQARGQEQEVTRIKALLGATSQDEPGR